MRCAVVGHVEWVEFARVPQHAARRARSCTRPTIWREPAGGGAVVARQLALLAGRCELFTALGAGRARPLGRSAGSPSSASTCTCSGAATTRRAWTHVDEDGERTITVLGDKLLPRRPAAACMGTTSSSSSRATPKRCVRRARRAFLAATARELPTLREAGVPLDLLVGSANDPAEQLRRRRSTARTVVLTDGARGGTVNGVPYPPVDARTGRRHLRRRRLVRGRARVRAGPRRRRCTPRSRSPRGPGRPCSPERGRTPRS